MGPEALHHGLGDLPGREICLDSHTPGGDSGGLGGVALQFEVDLEFADRLLVHEVECLWAILVDVEFFAAGQVLEPLHELLEVAPALPGLPGDEIVRHFFENPMHFSLPRRNEDASMIDHEGHVFEVFLV